MFGKHHIENIAVRFPVLKAGLAAIMLATVASCSGYEKMSQDTIDESYSVTGFNWQFGGTTLILLKIFEDNGNLAFCGAYTGTSSADLEMRATRQYFDTSNLYIGEERIGSMYFVPLVSIKSLNLRKTTDSVVVTDSGESANCVRTDKPWMDRYASDEIDVKGPQYITVID